VEPFLAQPGLAQHMAEPWVSLASHHTPYLVEMHHHMGIGGELPPPLHPKSMAQAMSAQQVKLESLGCQEHSCPRPTKLTIVGLGGRGVPPMLSTEKPGRPQLLVEAGTLHLATNLLELSSATLLMRSPVDQAAEVVGRGEGVAFLLELAVHMVAVPPLA